MRGVSKKADCNKQSAYNEIAHAARIYTQQEILERIESSLIPDSIRHPSAMCSENHAKPSMNW